MTFDDRVRALTYLGFTPRQTRFLALVALHSGFCVRRQFAAFAGVEYGKNVRAFLEQLVARGLAQRLQFDVNRGHVYHLSAGEVYRAIGQDDNRNRRATSPALIARKLMLLDFVLAQPADEWAATEADKVALFRDRYDIALAHLPRQMLPASASDRVRATRYFLDKLPIFLAGTPPTVHFAFLATGPGLQPFTRFLLDYRALCTRLPRWAVVLVCRAHQVDVAALRAQFHAFLAGGLPPQQVAADAELHWYFTTRRAVERDDLPAVSTSLLARFHGARARFAGTAFERLYAAWKAQGADGVDHAHTSRPTVGASGGTLLVHELPFTYTQFGRLPGVA